MYHDSVYDENEKKSSNEALLARITVLERELYQAKLHITRQDKVIQDILRRLDTIPSHVPHSNPTAKLNPVESALQHIEAVLGYKFKDLNLLHDAITHPSAGTSHDTEHGFEEMAKKGLKALHVIYDELEDELSHLPSTQHLIDHIASALKVSDICQFATDSNFTPAQAVGALCRAIFIEGGYEAAKDAVRHVATKSGSGIASRSVAATPTRGLAYQWEDAVEAFTGEKRSITSTTPINVQQTFESKRTSTAPHISSSTTDGNSPSRKFTPFYPQVTKTEIEAALNSTDAKSRLQEIAQRRYLALPAYREVSVAGPVHSPMFTIAVTFQDVTCHGQGSTKKTAEKEAARAMLTLLGENAV